MDDEPVEINTGLNLISHTKIKITKIKITLKLTEDHLSARAAWNTARHHPRERLHELVRAVHRGVGSVAVRVPRAQLHVVVAHVVTHSIRHPAWDLRSTLYELK